MQMTGYTKLFGSIITSTIWRENKETKILWITMLALKNKDGVVEGSVPGLSDMARLTLEETLAALEILRSPDAYSRTKEHDGRRIRDIEGGWLVLNHEKWRQKMNADERREYLKVKQREHRARSVNKCQQSSTPSTHTEADTDTKEEKKKASPSSVFELLPEDFSQSSAFRESWSGFVDHRKRIKAPLTERAILLLANKLKPWGAAKAAKALDLSVESGKWPGVFEPRDFNAPAQRTPAATAGIKWKEV